MENKIDMILEKITNIEAFLNEKYEYKANDKTIDKFLKDKEKDSFIGINCNMIYETYKNQTDYPVSIIKLNKAIKNKFKLKIKHTYKNKQNIYYWGE